MKFPKNSWILFVAIFIGIISVAFYIFFGKSLLDWMNIWKNNRATLEMTHETPNGTSYIVLKYWTGFYFQKNSSNSIGNTGSLIDFTSSGKTIYKSTGDIINLINTNNQRIISEWFDIFDKKYIVDNYKWIHILDDQWKSIIDKTFTDKAEAIKYLESLSPDACPITIKNYIPFDQSYTYLNADYASVVNKYKNKTRIVWFLVPWKCEWEKQILKWTKHTLLWYTIIDSVSLALEGARMWGFDYGPPSDYDDSDIVMNVEDIPVSNDNGFTSGKITIMKLKSWKNNVSLEIGGIMLTKDNIRDMKVVEKTKSDFQFIGKYIKVYPEWETKKTKEVSFDWSSVEAGNGSNPDEGYDNKQVEYNVNSDKYEGKYEYGVTVFTDKDGKTIGVMPENNTPIRDCGTSIGDCKFTRYDASSKEVIIMYRFFHNNSEPHFWQWETYWLNIDTWKVRKVPRISL